MLKVFYYTNWNSKTSSLLGKHEEYKCKCNGSGSFFRIVNYGHLIMDNSTAWQMKTLYVIYVACMFAYAAILYV